MSAARFALFAAAMTLFAGQAKAAECLIANRTGQQAEGVLRLIKFTNEAYARTEAAYILVLTKPACLQGEDEFDKVESSKRIHVFSLDDKILRKLRANLDKKVRVSGNAFGEHTIYHHAPIVMDVSEIERSR